MAHLRAWLTAVSHSAIAVATSSQRGSTASACHMPRSVIFPSAAAARGGPSWRSSPLGPSGPPPIRTSERFAAMSARSNTATEPSGSTNVSTLEWMASRLGTLTCSRDASPPSSMKASVMMVHSVATRIRKGCVQLVGSLTSSSSMCGCTVLMARLASGSVGKSAESWCITPYKCWLRRPSGLKKYSCRTLVSEIMGASSTSPSSGEAEGGRSCAARVTTPPPIERPSQKMGVPAGSDAANSSWIPSRSCARSSNRWK
mmetsp:Transcript_31064/g.95067  ORF Transcript_31064/g.95067 Transcript_31064/m.95067 type:complete len:258 (-) Transcript_31064:541-1314(-)